ncbi:MJ0042-type zinc finger domain-containing protein [Rivibacter subsaxonicus]|uniref:Putative Zn finger-like uncharacterized protein n=1 Tax=Rivibacter subsaxonicus TaxID=457575 RepID=A0A4Q7VZR9_9BURK|nr:MJ0042-type zinc finger domain-containing protein [Rivibacter subsaxonicus]RZU02068.1 putative Zn finger-like uncharacterized protein [Rivibacter subsaxonicus]
MGVWHSDLADGIRKHGFRKWYERELIASHAHLVLTFFCTIGLFAAFEVFDRQSPAFDQLSNVAAVLLCAVIGIWALRRYLYLLTHAEATANQAVCPVCKTYARFDVAAEQNPRNAGVLNVRCRKCTHRWPIEG